jgi:hypothetical protein
MWTHLAGVLAAACLVVTQKAPPIGAGSTLQPAQPRVKVSAAGWVRLPGGQAAAVVRFDIEKDWHMYWENPGDSGGGSPTARLKFAPGWSLGDPIFPRPSIVTEDGHDSYVYDKTWEWILPLTGPAQTTPPACSFDLTWMVCRERCEVGKATVEFAAPGGELQPLGVVRLGRSIPGGGVSAKFDRETDAVTLVGSGKAGETLRFIASVMPGVDLKPPIPSHTVNADGRFEMKLPLQIRPQNSLGKALALKGLVLFGPAEADPCASVFLQLNKTSAPN